ncbi:MAG: histidine phosphatase family protein [Candidatus Hydrogenedentota bacterium]|nr:MAG: histidine phosphatase family protein [Candidatus Hydrogenedentota bacterium]
MADITLYLLRHGESTANVDNVFASHRIDAPLSLDGIRQAQELAKWLTDFPIAGIYASPLLRARQTGEIVSEPLNLEPVITDSLVEIDVGDLEGKAQDHPEHRAAFNRVLSLWENGCYREGFVGGETLLDAEKRLRKLLDKIANDGPNHVLLVGHCLLFMALIWLFCENHGPTVESGHMRRGHVSILYKAGERFRLEKFDIAPPT